MAGLFQFYGQRVPVQPDSASEPIAGTRRRSECEPSPIWSPRDWVFENGLTRWENCGLS